MKPLPTGYRTATSDGHRIVVYSGKDAIGEVEAPADATHQELVDLEDAAADVAIKHAQKAEAKAAKQKRGARAPAATEESVADEEKVEEEKKVEEDEDRE